MEQQVELTVKGDLRRLRLRPGDILAIKLTEPNTDAEVMMAIAERMRAMLLKSGHANQVIIADKGMNILVIAGG